jgi:hypothetical protein
LRAENPVCAGIFHFARAKSRFLMVFRGFRWPKKDSSGRLAIPRRGATDENSPLL